jgi:hypothetical protein
MALQQQTTALGEARPRRRRRVRVRWNTPAKAELLPRRLADQPVVLLVEDLAEGGMRASSPIFVPLGARLLIELGPDADGQPVRTIGTVVWERQLPDQDRWTLGMAFAEASASEQARLRGLLRLRQFPH